MTKKGIIELLYHTEYSLEELTKLGFEERGKFGTGDLYIFAHNNGHDLYLMRASDVHYRKDKYFVWLNVSR
jgi:hypothetical protein